MAKHMLKGFAVAGLLGLAGLAVGCNDNQEPRLRDEGRQVEQEVDNAANEVEGFGREVNEDLREGTGGSGDVDVDIGEKEGVINDGEGPFEQNDVRGDDNILRNGEGPIEDSRER
jgi:hypothetical protein